MITKTLKEFASPIIAKAMASGARGSSTTNTNYGGIGDALFKKSQLDMNMATLTFDMKQQNLQMQSNLANSKATNSLQILDIEDQYNQMVARDTAASQDMGGMEKVMGTLQGVATGAVAGFAAGNVPGAIIGGAAGGAVAADTYYGSGGAAEKRETGQRNQQMMGTVANMAGTLRGMYDKRKGAEANKSLIKDLAGVTKDITNMGPGKARDDKVAEYQSKLAAGNATLAEYFGPEEINKINEGIRAGENAIFSNDPKKRALGGLAANAAYVASDEIFKSSSGEGREALRQVHSSNSALIDASNGYKSTSKGQSAAAFSRQMGGIDPTLGQEVTDMYTGGLSSIRQAAPARGGGGGGANYQSAQGAKAAPSQGRTVIQPTQTSQAPSSSVDNSQSYMLNHPGVGGGTVMDDGMGFLRDPMGAIEKTNAMGADAVKALGLGNRSAREDRVRSRVEEEVRADNPKMSEADIRETTDYRMTSSDNMNEVGNPNQRVDDSDRAANLRQQGRPGAADQVNDYRNRQAEERVAQKEVQDDKQSPEMIAKNFQEVKFESAGLDEEINNNIESAKSSQMMSEQGLAKAEQIRNAQSSLGEMEKLVGSVPNDSQAKAMAAKVYLEGIRLKKTGQALGASIGMSGGIAGVIAGNVVGDSLGEILPDNIGRGSQRLVSSILSKKEIDAINTYARVSNLAIASMVKVSDGNMVTEPEAKAMQENFFNYGMSKDQQLSSLVTLKRYLASRAGSISEFSAVGKAQYDYKQKMPIDYRARSQKEKAYEESFQRESGRRDRASQDDGDDAFYNTPKWYPKLSQ